MQESKEYWMKQNSNISIKRDYNYENSKNNKDQSMSSKLTRLYNKLELKSLNRNSFTKLYNKLTI